MKQILLLLLSTIFLIGCTASKGRQSYEEALHYIEQGDAPQALACLKEAAELASDDSLRMGIYSDMGRLLFDEGLQEQALGAYHMALETSQAMADSLGMAYVLFDIANIYRTRDDDDSCVYYFDTAMSLALSQKDSLLATDIRNQLAGYYLWHKDYERARQLLFPSLSQEAKMTGGICFMAADLYRQTGPADSTRYYCKLLLQNEETGLRQMGHKWLADLLLSEGQVEEAAKHLQQYELLTDTLMQETDTEALRRISALYDYSLREQENARLEQRNIIAVAIIMVLILVLVAAILYFSRRRMIYRMKVQQLEHLLADYRQRDEKDTERQNGILTDTPICRHINRLLSDSRQPSMTDEDWHILENTFAKIQPTFLSRLQTFHKFSSHEMHICLLLRLGLQPAALAQLSAHSKQSVSSTRSRLFEKVFGQKGTPAQWDEFIQSL
jgi:tetratricopeptide (TPR) repeat protein